MAEVCHNAPWDQRLFSFGQMGDDCYFADLGGSNLAALRDYRLCRDRPTENNCHIGYTFGYAEVTDAVGDQHDVCIANCGVFFNDLQALKDKEALINILGLVTADPALQGAASTLDVDLLVARGSAGTRAVSQFLRLSGAERASLESLEDVFANPTVLTGLNPGDVRELLGETPGWVDTPLLRGSHAGQGWALRETIGTASSTGPTWAELFGPTDGHLG